MTEAPSSAPGPSPRGSLPELRAPGPFAPAEPPPSPAPAPASRRRRRWPIALGLLALLLAAAAGGGFWTAHQMRMESFVRYNLNRIANMADRAGRQTAPVLVVALGGSGLRDRTLDESGMAEVAARHGVEQFQFLRIVHPQAEFADFTPLLDRILRLKPALVLVDRGMLARDRSGLGDVEATLFALAGLWEGRDFLPDQVAIQYGRSCAAAGAPATAARPPAAGKDADLPGLPALARFAERAKSAGIPVLLLDPAPALGNDGAGNDAAGNDAAVPVSQAAGHGLPVLRPVMTVQPAAAGCKEARAAWSAALMTGVAETLAAPRTESAALP